MKLVHKDLRFFFSFMKTKLKFFHAIDVCIHIPWTVLFLFGDRTFPFHTPIFPFLCRTIVWSASLGFLLPCRVPLQPQPPCLPALLEDRTSGSVFTASRPVFDGSVFSGAPTRLICCFSFYWCVCLLLLLLVWSVRGSTGLEKACIQETYVRLTDLTCLMKAVRKSTCVFHPPRPHTMSFWKQGLGASVC